MTITSEAAYYEAIGSPYQRIRIAKNSITTVAGHIYSTWLAGGFPAAGAAPTSAAAPTKSTTGAWASSSATLFDSSGTARILKVVIDYAPTVGPGGMLTVCDRLSHQGGLGGTTTGAQTTNLPTAALTRYTGGTGVEAGLEVYTQVGSTGTTSTISYTNQAGTSGQTSLAMTFGGTGYRELSRLIAQSLASGDQGVQAVASVTLAASTLTAGNFGVTLYYPLFSVPLDDILSLKGYADALYGFGTWFPQVQNSACLFGAYRAVGTATGVMCADFLLCEDR